jgi:hypothetical protein
MDKHFCVRANRSEWRYVLQRFAKRRAKSFIPNPLRRLCHRRHTVIPDVRNSFSVTELFFSIAAGPPLLRESTYHRAAHESIAVCAYSTDLGTLWAENPADDEIWCGVGRPPTQIPECPTREPHADEKEKKRLRLIALVIFIAACPSCDKTRRDARLHLPDDSC